jgi:hypothetical protein
MARREGDNFVTDILETLDFGGEENGIGRGGQPSLIKGSHPDWVSCSDNSISSVSYIVQYEAEKSVQFCSDFNVDLIVKVKDHFTIRMSFEVVWFLQSFPKSSMVVYFAVDRKDKCGIIVGDGLSSRIYTPCYHILVDGNNDGVSTDADDCQAFVAKDGVVLDDIA